MRKRKPLPNAEGVLKEDFIVGAHFLGALIGGEDNLSPEERESLDQFLVSEIMKATSYESAHPAWRDYVIGGPNENDAFLGACDVTGEKSLCHTITVAWRCITDFGDCMPAGVTYDRATLRTSDLIHGLLDAMKEHLPDAYAKFVGELDNPYDKRIIALYEDNRDIPEAPYVDEFFNETLWERMIELAPPFTNFGAHEGNGSCFGYWPVDADEIREEAAYMTAEGTLVTKWGHVDVNEDEDPKEALQRVLQGQTGGGATNVGCFYLDVNERGNIALYWVDLVREVEVWAFV